MRDSTRRFIEASGVTSTMQNIIRLMTDAADGIPASVKAFVARKFQAGIANLFETRIAPLVERTYSDDEMAQLAAFYESPVGQAMKSKGARMQEECFALGREWGDEIVQQIDPEVRRLMATEFGTEDIQ